MSVARGGRAAIFVVPVLPHPPTTGGQKRTLRLIEAAAAAGAVPHLVTADVQSPAAAADALRGRGWNVDIVPEPLAGAAGRVAQHMRRLPSPYLYGVAARVRALAPEASFVQLEHTMSAPLAPPLPGPPRVLSLHNHDSAMLAASAASRRTLTGPWARELARARAMGAVERRAIPGAEVVVVVSGADADAVEALGGRPLLAPNGVDDEFFAVDAAAGDPRRVLFFGHFAYSPNAEGILRFACEAWPRVTAEVPGATLEVAGGAMPEALREKLKGVAGVDVVGLVESVPASLARAAVTIVPIWQGGGTRLKVLEAMAAARPVVGTRLGVEEIGFVPGRHGLVADTPLELADAIVALLGAAPRARELGAAGREHAQAFRWTRTTAGLRLRYARYL